MPATMEAPASTRVLDRRLIGRAPVSQEMLPTRYQPVSRSKKAEFLATFDLEKLFTLLGFSVASFLVLVFGADLVFGWPFLQASLLFDATLVMCGIALAYLSGSVLRDQLRGLKRPSGTLSLE